MKVVETVVEKIQRFYLLIVKKKPFKLASLEQAFRVKIKHFIKNH